MKKKKFVQTALIGLGLLFMIGCSSEKAGQTDVKPDASKPDAAPKIVIGESSPIASNPNQQAITEGQKKAAAKLGWTLETLDANLSSDKQITDVDTLISKKVNGITVWTLNQGAADAAYKRAADQGIPLVGFNSNSEFIATEIRQQSDLSCVPEEEAAKIIKEKAQGAKVIVIGGAPIPTIQYRVACFEEAAKNNGLNIVAKQENLQDTASAAQPLVQNMLTKHPDVQAIWAYNDPSALGAAAVVQSEQMKEIMIFGINGSQEAIDAIKKGMMTATWDTNSPDAGAAAIAVMAMHYKDGKPVAELPKLIEIPTKMWDQSNVDQYVPWADRDVSLELPAGGSK